jgi:hypothetical protein
VDNGADTDSLHIAAFVAQALDLEDDPNLLAAELLPLKRDQNAGIWTIELDSSVGAAAFLVYHYVLSSSNDDGQTGRELFDADLATLTRAAERETPGPRILAHATTDDEAFVLATTPATFRALSGEESTAEPAAITGKAPTIAESDQARREAASELLTLLQSADQQAQTWLNALGAEAVHRRGGEADTETLAMNDEESALALYLLDDRSIQHLLRVLNFLIENARRLAEDATGGSART